MNLSATATPSLDRYLTPHTIEPIPSPDGWQVCRHCSVRVYRVLSQRFQHDPNQLRKLRSAAAREDLDRGIVSFPSPDEIDRAGQIAREAAATFAAIEAENDYFRAHENDAPDEACVESGHAPSCTCGLGSDPLLVVGGNGVYGVEIEWT